MAEEKATRERIITCVKLLKTTCNLSGRKIASISQMFGFKFSETYLFKAYKKDITGKFRYGVSLGSLKKIEDALRKMLRHGLNEFPELSEKVLAAGIDLSESQDNFPNTTHEVPRNLRLGQIELKPVTNQEHFISWSLSKALELNATRVLSITPNLTWAKKNVAEIIDTAKKSEDTKFLFILTDAGGLHNRIPMEIEIENADLRDQVVIRNLFDLPEFKEVYANAIPIPYDVVIYENTKYSDSDTPTNIGVMSTEFIKPETNLATNLQQGFDIKVAPERTRAIYNWFQHYWSKLSKQEKENLQAFQES